MKMETTYYKAQSYRQPIKNQKLSWKSAIYALAVNRVKHPPKHMHRNNAKQEQINNRKRPKLRPKLRIGKWQYKYQKQHCKSIIH